MSKQYLTLRFKPFASRIVIAILLVGLAVSGWLNTHLYRKTIFYYTELCASKLDPDGRRWSIHLPDRVTLSQPTDLLIIGDSRAQAWKLPIHEHQINAGISGQTTTQILSRYREHALAYSPRVILIQAGINDLKAIPLMPDKKHEIIQLCKDQLAEMVKLARQSGSQVILTTIIAPGDIPWQRRAVWSAEVDDAIRSVNSFLTTLHSEGVEVVDLSETLADTRGNVAMRYQRDFLHLSAAGYTALNIKMRPVLEKHGLRYISE